MREFKVTTSSPCVDRTQLSLMDPKINFDSCLWFKNVVQRAINCVDYKMDSTVKDEVDEFIRLLRSGDFLTKFQNAVRIIVHYERYLMDVEYLKRSKYKEVRTECKGVYSIHFVEITNPKEIEVNKQRLKLLKTKSDELIEAHRRSLAAHRRRLAGLSSVDCHEVKRRRVEASP